MRGSRSLIPPPASRRTVARPACQAVRRCQSARLAARGPIMSMLTPVQGGALPPEAWEPLLRVAQLARRPLERFFRIEAASGILLMIATAAALLWANSPWAESYARLLHTPLGIRIGPFQVEHTLEWLINDGLMAIFFFVVG